MWDWEMETARTHIYVTYSVFFLCPVVFHRLVSPGRLYFPWSTAYPIWEREGWSMAEDTVQPLNLASHKKGMTRDSNSAYSWDPHFQEVPIPLKSMANIRYLKVWKAWITCWKSRPYYQKLWGKKMLKNMFSWHRANSWQSLTLYNQKVKYI